MNEFANWTKLSILPEPAGWLCPDRDGNSHPVSPPPAAGPTATFSWIPGTGAPRTRSLTLLPETVGTDVTQGSLQRIGLTALVALISGFSGRATFLARRAIEERITATALATATSPALYTPPRRFGAWPSVPATPARL